MNKEQKIKELIKSIEENTKALEKLTKKEQNGGRWIPENEDGFQIFGEDGQAVSYAPNSIQYKEDFECLINNYIVFPNSWNLSDLIEKQKIQRALWECAKRLNPKGWKQEFITEDCEKYAILYDIYLNDYRVAGSVSSVPLGVVCFATQEIAQQALEELQGAGVLK